MGRGGLFSLFQGHKVIFNVRSCQWLDNSSMAIIINLFYSVKFMFITSLYVYASAVAVISNNGVRCVVVDP